MEGKLQFNSAGANRHFTVESAITVEQQDRHLPSFTVRVNPWTTIKVSLRPLMPLGTQSQNTTRDGARSR